MSATFADETVLDGSRINVDTHTRVVTLKGRGVPSGEGAATIASGTEGVTRVVNELVVT